MICPFCQADLDATSLSCPRCGAAYPGAAGGVAAFGFRLRTIGIGIVILLIATLMLVNCVLQRLPRGGLTPDAQSTAAQRALLMMQQHEQGTQNQGTPPPRR